MMEIPMITIIFTVLLAPRSFHDAAPSDGFSGSGALGLGDELGE
jgi:hypothetical protein